MRIDKVLEEKGFGSRKVVKRLFQRKLVVVDGVTIYDGSYNVDDCIHQVSVDGVSVTGFTHKYLMLNKPNGFVTAVTDENHQTVLDLIEKSDKSSTCFPVGRLDRDTEGLLLITDNGQLSYQLLLPEKRVSKVYEVTLKEELVSKDVARFAEGIVFNGGEQCQPAKLEILSKQKAHLTIEEGKFHQVKKMFLATGKKVTHLKRIAMGPLKLDETLPIGHYRHLTTQELQLLKPYFK